MQGLISFKLIFFSLMFVFTKSKIQLFVKYISLQKNDDSAIARDFFLFLPSVTGESADSRGFSRSTLAAP